MRAQLVIRSIAFGLVPAFLSALGSAQGIAPLTTVNGRVLDLTRNAAGDLLYCAENGDIGTITTTGTVNGIATAATGPFPNPLRCVVESPDGSINVVDLIGDIYRLPNGQLPATKIYTDFFMVANPPDMIGDALGDSCMRTS